ncbi:hypothetical protein DVH24_009647 [Malus domestica]|uniref:Uncharacterized protein n=1 Tax=Malus domestica TaxID=3750 RepID=A0A498JNW5_MALDO|nr:hypothetical protein DVH24_009647 [Malus domestica]
MAALPIGKFTILMGASILVSVLAKEIRVGSKLVDCSGEDVAHYSPNCTHVIVDKICMMIPYVLLLEMTPRLESEEHVHRLAPHSFDVRLPIDPTCRACPPTLSKLNPGFSSTCNPISPRAKSRASMLGIKFSMTPTPNCLFSAMASEGQSPPISWRDSYKGMFSDNSNGLIRALSSSLFIGASFIVKKKGLKKVGASDIRAAKMECGLERESTLHQ